MKTAILSLALATGAATQVHAQALPELGGLPGGGTSPEPGLLLDLLNDGFDQFAGDGGMLPAGEGVAQLTGLGEQVRVLVVDPLDEALPDPLLLPLLSDLSIVLSDVNTGGNPSLPGLPGGGDDGGLPDVPGADDLPDLLQDLIPESGGLEPPAELAELLDVMALQSALEDLTGEAGGAEQLTMLLDSLSGDDLGDPGAITDLLDPTGLQGMLENLIPDSGGLEPPAELAELLDVMALQSALEDLTGEAGGAEQLTMLLDSLSGGDLGDPGAITDLLDPTGLQDMLENLIPDSGGLEPPAELAELLDVMMLQSALEDLMAGAGDAEQLTMVLDGLTGAIQP